MRGLRTNPSVSRGWCGVCCGAHAMDRHLAAFFQPSAREWPIMPPAFILTFTALMLYGAPVAMLVAAAAALVPGLMPARPLRGQTLIDASHRCRRHVDCGPGLRVGRRRLHIQRAVAGRADRRRGRRLSRRAGCAGERRRAVGRTPARRSIVAGARAGRLPDLPAWRVSSPRSSSRSSTVACGASRRWSVWCCSWRAAPIADYVRGSRNNIGAAR